MWLANIITRILLVGLFFVSWAGGQEPAGAPGASPPESQPANQAPQEPLGRTTPYGAVVGFMRAFESHELARSAQYLDSKETDSAKEQLAGQLGRVLNQAMALEIGKLSREPSGDLEDGLRKSRELVGVATIDSISLDIALDRVERPGEPPIWLFSSETLAGIPDFAGHIEGPWQERYVPGALVDREFLSIQLYRWIAVPVVLALIYFGTRALAWLLALLLSPLAIRLSDYTALHRSILDVFNDYGVQIMTPAYEGDPDVPKVVPREKWFESPAAPPVPSADGKRSRLNRDADSL